MKIQVCNTQSIFDFFKKGIENYRRDPAEAWKLEATENDSGIMPLGYRSDTIELPSPFSHAIMTFRKVSRFYEFAIGFVNRDPELFVNSSPTLLADFAEMQYEFLPTSADGTGYILDKKRIPLIGIRGLGEQSQIRELSLGSNGSAPRKFGEYDDFAADIGLIQKISNIYLESLFKNSKYSQNKEAFKDLHIYINI